ncbi:hypothetical protein A3F29_01970 [Candidatus Roizmanbacteria bacterium RIFCSPHIGHO2_12_FULL_33_9]|uniref:Methyltransferase type 11 domain-containing protein n=1 Tax=Candidatus Roizmanbacteria bacterium RIFCSPHIGHO2_12_FULL_33_9 TaxID=1802045 RepID=A0A1F7HJC7_9BACT|nr:MAG: hypothetical protein A3F29_01970 [Candidatus Roizmanbacteria bacterium RIFCSPHIGHO2_12_FULL_33_9]
MVEVIGVETRIPVSKDRSLALTTALERPDQVRNNFAKYLKRLGLVKEDLGHTVLDIGSSVEEKFAIKASKNGIQVYSVNPQLIDDDVRFERNKARKKLNRKKLKPESVAALSIALPFKDESFDTVVSLYALPTWVPEEEWDKSFREVVRVLKPGGKAYLAPVFFPHKEKILQVCEKIEGIEFSTKQVDYLKDPITVLTITKPQ